MYLPAGRETWMLTDRTPNTTVAGDTPREGHFVSQGTHRPHGWGRPVFLPGSCVEGHRGEMDFHFPVYRHRRGILRPGRAFITHGTHRPHGWGLFFNWRPWKKYTRKARATTNFVGARKVVRANGVRHAPRGKLPFGDSQRDPAHPATHQQVLAVFLLTKIIEQGQTLDFCEHLFRCLQGE